jgi:hypothetical protein
MFFFYFNQHLAKSAGILADCNEKYLLLLLGDTQRASRTRSILQRQLLKLSVVAQP